MIRTMIKIDEEKCNGCALCVNACHESALAIIDGKAKLIRDDYCDGLGNCLPVCPTGAITFEEREALEYDEAAVLENQRKAVQEHTGCPGSRTRDLKQPVEVTEDTIFENGFISPISQLRQWPVQIKLVPVKAPYFKGANLLIAADCTAFAYGNFHQEFIRNHVTLIGCPKLDDTDYSVKLAEIIKNNDLASITIARMEVPCCGGIEYAAKQAIKESGNDIPCNVVTISVEGEILNG